MKRFCTFEMLGIAPKGCCDGIGTRLSPNTKLTDLCVAPLIGATQKKGKLMNRKQIVTTLSLGLIGMILVMSTGCDRFDLGMIDDNRDELDTVDPNLVRANTMFGFKLLDELRKTDQDNNTLLSPYSLSVALAMARNGAGGATERAIIDALQLQELDPASINTNYIYLQRALQVPDSKVTLEIANALWAAEGIEFDPGFLDRNNQFLDTEIANTRFHRADECFNHQRQHKCQHQRSDSQCCRRD